MDVFDNITKTVKEDLCVELKNGSRLSIAAACFSIYAFYELKEQLESVDEFRFIFTSPTLPCRRNYPPVAAFQLRFPKVFPPIKHLLKLLGIRLRGVSVCPSPYSTAILARIGN